MAIKKNEIYSSLWASCDKLRGGMDASQYCSCKLFLCYNPVRQMPKSVFFKTVL